MNDRVRTLLRLPSSQPLVIGHRGLSSSHPENTIESFDAAISAGVDMIELDFHATADGHLACVHDDVLDRYAHAQPQFVGRPISSMTMAELRGVDVGSWKHARFAAARIPELDDVLARYADALLLIERKTGTPEQTLAALERHAAGQRVIVQSFDWDFVTQFAALAPGVAVAALGEGPLAPRLPALFRTGAIAAHWDKHLSDQDVAALHGAGLPVWVYTLNHEPAWRAASAMRIDGITTDRGDALRAMLDKR